MGLFDIFSGGGKKDINRGYDAARQYLNPYIIGGGQDYTNYRNYASNEGQFLNPYQNAGHIQYDAINQTPEDYYNSIMKGYSESPQAKYEQEQAMRAANSGASASGMLGSGAYQKGIQQNAADIASRDQQRYFGNVVGANEMQMGYLDNLQNRQRAYEQMQQYLTSLGYGAATGAGQNEISRGKDQASLDRQSMEDWMSVLGYGVGGLANSFNGNNNQDYLRAAMMAAG